MKGNLILKTLMIILLFFITSCKEYFITTKINSDGTCEKTIAIKADENEIKLYRSNSDSIANFGTPSGAFRDSGWTIVQTFDKDKKQQTITAVKKYNSYQDLIDDSRRGNQIFKPIPEVEIEKEFRFFFTYYTYREIYKPYFVFNKIPIEKYFDEADIAKIKEYKDTTWVKQKLGEYDKTNLIITFLDIAENELFKSDRIKLPCLTDAEKKKELIAELSKAIDIKDNQNNALEKKIFRKYCGEEIGAKFDRLLDKNPHIERMYESMREYEGTYNNSVILPGMITSANSKIIEGNKVAWNFDSESFKYFDYEMTAESREVNTWVIAISGAVVLLLLLGLTLPKLRKKTTF